MYERSAIVLERYIEKVLEFNKQYNLKQNYSNFKSLIEEIENYISITTKEGKVIEEFDEIVKEIENIQKKQEKLSNENQKLEEDRNKLFYDLGEDPRSIEAKMEKIENAIDKNNEELKALREEFIKYSADFIIRQKERNKCEKDRRVSESNHINFIKKIVEEFNEIDLKDITTLKDFITTEKEEVKENVLEVMVKNGKNEKVSFNKDVMTRAIEQRIEIAEKEAECYILVYDKMRRLLSEVDSENIKLTKYKKILRDVSVKLNFLFAEKEYIVEFLDYERMTAISGTRAHKKMMEDACNAFELDMIQIKNLYELVLKEISNKATKKAYKELYNKTYLKNIEDKEKNFEEEVNNIKINMGTVINSNYWRIEGIKNIYNIFLEEISTKFEKDLSEYTIQETEEVEEIDEPDEVKDTIKIFEEDYDDEYDDYEYDEDDEYDDDEDDDDEEYNEDDKYEEDDDEDEDENEYDEDDDEDEYDEDDSEYDEYDEDEEEIEDEYEVEKIKEKNYTNFDDEVWNEEKENKYNKAKQSNGIFNKLFRDRKAKNKK